MILPMLKMDSYELSINLKNTYLGNVDYEGDNSWGNYIYLLVDSAEDNLLASTMRSHELYCDEYDPTPGETMYVFKIPKDIQDKVCVPFKEGKYSEIDKDYIDNHLTWYYPNKKKGKTLQIVTKDAELRKYWEDLIGIPLPEDAEVWSKPKPENEIYNYEN